MKFCKDCKWYRNPPPIPYGYISFSKGEWCSNAKNGKVGVDYVHNNPIVTGAKGLEGLRQDPKLCGPTAKWFEEKEKPVPKCVDCKFMYSGCCEHTVTDDPLTGFGRWAGTCYTTRTNEEYCGKYGKWFEKKEISYIEFTTKATERLVGDTPKKQSWLCKLICGRKK